MRYLILLLILSSCSASYRFNNLIKHHPEFAKTTSMDTTIITQISEADTTFNFNSSHDTTIIHNHNLTQKYYFNRKDSTVYISGKCDPDTIRIVQHTTTIKPSDNNGGWKEIGLYIIIALLIILLLFKK